MKTDLQKLLQQRLDDLVEKHKSLRTQRDELDAQTERVFRDISAIREALAVEMRATGQITEKPSSNGSSLHGLKLGEAIRVLRQENPRISKKSIRQRLEEIGFDFKGKRPGTAIHMTLVQMEKHKNGDM